MSLKSLKRNNAMPNAPWQQNEFELDPKHCDTCNQVIQSGSNLRGFLQKCKACGLNLDQLIEENERNMQFASVIKQQFFPSMP